MIGFPYLNVLCKIICLPSIVKPELLGEVLMIEATLSDATVDGIVLFCEGFRIIILPLTI